MTRRSRIRRPRPQPFRYPDLPRSLEKRLPKLDQAIKIVLWQAQLANVLRTQ